MATLVYIHGESYEWNSGNLYDGTVVAAHSNIIVVTINFRLGIFGTYPALDEIIPMFVRNTLPKNEKLTTKHFLSENFMKAHT